VELQQRLADFAQAGTALFAISYDPVASLAEFAERFGITYPLLSDEGSVVIRALGLYNEHLLEQHRFYGREPRPDQYGVPYPGIFHLDGQGIIVEKQFEQSYRVRPAPAVLLERLLADATPTDATPSFAVSQRVERPGVSITAGLDSATYHPYEQHVLTVRLELAPGVHVYAAPVPEGYTALEISVAPQEGLEVRPADLPASQLLEVEAPDDLFSLGSEPEQFQVYEGTVTATLPFDVVPFEDALTLAVRVRYQACTDTLCYPPDTVDLELPLRGVDLIRT
jgi:peroxiredoxin